MATVGGGGLQKAGEGARAQRSGRGGGNGQWGPQAELELKRRRRKNKKPAAGRPEHLVGPRRVWAPSLSVIKSEKAAGFQIGF